MTAVDLLRIAVIGATGLGIGLICVITVVAYSVLKPPAKLGFLVQHIIGIGIGVGGAMLLLAEFQLGRIGDPPTWRLPVTVAVISLIDMALVLVLRVERGRLVEKRAVERVR